MLGTKKKSYVTQFFLKFMLTQITILNTFEEYNRIINYMNTDFNYVKVGPYMLKTSMIPTNKGCHQFYQTSIDFVQYYGSILTRDRYMETVASTLQKQWILLEVSLVGLTVVLSLVMELMSFIWDQKILILLDNLFTLLLPHFSLYLNTISWGDICIQQSPIFNILQFTIIGKVGFLTITGIVILLILLMLLVCCNIRMSSPLVFVYVALLCLFGCYVVTIDIINLYSSTYILRVLLVAKIILMGFQLYMVYSN